MPFEARLQRRNLPRYFRQQQPCYQLTDCCTSDFIEKAVQYVCLHSAVYCLYTSHVELAQDSLRMMTSNSHLHFILFNLLCHSDKQQNVTLSHTISLLSYLLSRNTLIFSVQFFTQLSYTAGEVMQHTFTLFSYNT